MSAAGRMPVSAPAPDRTGTTGVFQTIAAALLVGLLLLWPPPATARPGPGPTAAPRPASILALDRLVDGRVALRAAALGRLDRQRLALRGELTREERRAAALALRIDGLRRTHATLGDGFAALTAELRLRRQRLDLQRRERERAARALLGRLHRSSRSDAAIPGRVRLLLGELLRDGGGAAEEIVRLEVRQRELARARAAVSMALTRLTRTRERLEGRLSGLRIRLAALLTRRSEAGRRLAAARARQQQLRSLAALARALAALTSPSCCQRPALLPPARSRPNRIPKDHALRVFAALPEIAPAGFEPRALPAEPPPRGAAVAPDPQSSILPVAGRIVSRFGDENAGILAQGITILVDRDQPVRAVRGGRAAFAGPFREFGLVLILDHGDGYHTLLAGMTRLDVRRGDLIAAGAVVGRVERSGRKDGRLYIELRQQGRPVNPLPWLAARADRIRG